MRLLTVDQVADALQMHPQTVRKMIKNGIIPSTRIGRAVRVDEAELVILARQGTAARYRLTPLTMISHQQLKAFHAKADRCDRMRGWKRLTAKRQVLDEATERTGKPITSASHLDEYQAMLAMERLDELADEAETPTPA